MYRRQQEIPARTSYSGLTMYHSHKGIVPPYFVGYVVAGIARTFAQRKFWAIRYRWSQSTRSFLTYYDHSTSLGCKPAFYISQAVLVRLRHQLLRCPTVWPLATSRDRIVLWVIASMLKYALLISSISCLIGNTHRQSSHQHHREQPRLESSRRPFHVLKPLLNHCYFCTRFFYATCKSRSLAIERNDLWTTRQTNISAHHLRLYNIYRYPLCPLLL
jgi:hypothetical protein